MKKIVFILALFSISLFANKPYINIKRLNKAPLEVVLNQMAKELSKQLPKKINSFTTLKKVYTQKNRLYFIKILDKTKSIEIKEALKIDKSKLFIKELFLSSDKNEICKEEIFKYVLSRGAIIQYQWIDEGNNKVFNYKIDNRTCLY